MTRKVLFLGLGVAFLSGMTTYAHHSQAAQYDTSKKVSIEGTMVQFQFRNPHSFIQVEAPDETGQVVRWSIEWGGSGQLTGQGVSRTTLEVWRRRDHHGESVANAERPQAAHAHPPARFGRFRMGVAPGRGGGLNGNA